jgi:DNA repair protein RecN (Recombination protein N)
MLERLSIQNFILIESCTIEFESGFTVITGETGAGKSIVLSALSFLLGEKADMQCIREGCEYALCEATFSCAHMDVLLPIFEEAGIECEDETIFIKRKVSSAGKSQTWVNNTQVSLTLLKKITPHLLSFSNQHAHLLLLEEAAPTRLLDTFADMNDQVVLFQKTHAKKKALIQNIQLLETSAAERDHQLVRLQEDLQEIQEMSVQPGEEDALFSEFRLMNSSQELVQKGQALQTLFEQISQKLAQHKNSIDSMAQIDQAFQPMKESYTSIAAEAKELSFELSRYVSCIEMQPERLESIEKRLSEISRLKRKFGDLTAFVQSAQEKLSCLQQEVALLDTYKNDIQAIQKQEDLLAKEISMKRFDAARRFAEQVTQELQSLNMPQASFQVQLSPQERSYLGDEKVCFYLKANVGEKSIDIQEGASGGELARIFLAITSILLERWQSPTILFDEIDANIGGTTATIIGKKLSTMGKSLQIISITHFSQVAKYADTHLCIYKYEQDGRTFTQVKILDNATEKQHELSRMVGV